MSADPARAHPVVWLVGGRRSWLLRFGPAPRAAWHWPPPGGGSRASKSTPASRRSRHSASLSRKRIAALSRSSARSQLAGPPSSSIDNEAWLISAGVVDDLARRAGPSLNGANQLGVERTEQVGLVAEKLRAAVLGTATEHAPRVCGLGPPACSVRVRSREKRGGNRLGARSPFPAPDSIQERGFLLHPEGPRGPVMASGP
jgi:hypothetical protein